MNRIAYTHKIGRVMVVETDPMPTIVRAADTTPGSIRQASYHPGRGNSIRRACRRVGCNERETQQVMARVRRWE